MSIKKVFFTFAILFILQACTPEPETAVTPTSLPPTVTTMPSVTAVPPTTAPTATMLPTATAVLPTATFIPTPTPMQTVPPDPLVIAPENVAQLTQVAQFGQGDIADITWSPDGATFAVASGTGVHLYDTATWQPGQLLETDEVPGSVEFLPEGSLLAVTFYGFGSSFHELWHSETGQLMRQVRFDSGFSSMSTDGQLITVEQFDLESFRLRWQDLETNEVQRTLDLSHVPQAYSPDGATLVVWINESTLDLINAASGETLFSLDTPGGLWSIAYSPDGAQLAVGSGDRGTWLWDVDSGERLQLLDGDSYGLAWSPNGRLLAVSDGDGTVRLWEWATGQLMHTLMGGSMLAFSPDGRELAAATRDNISFFDVASGALLRTLSGYSESAEGMAFSPDGLTLAVATSYKIHLLAVPSLELQENISPNTYVTSVAFNPDGQTLAWGGGSPGTLQLWDLTSHQLIGTVAGETTGIYSLAFSPDGRLLANTDTDWMVWLRDAATLELLFSLPAAQFAFHPNGRYLATASELTVDSGEWQVHIWDLNSFERLYTFDQIGQSIAFSPDGHLLVYQGATLSEWDVETGQMVRLLPGMWPIGPISPNGHLMASTYRGDSPQATIVDLVTGQLLRDMAGIYKLVFSPDGRLIAGSGNGTVRLWGLPPATP